MQNILTTITADNLYWLARHLQRIEDTLLEIDATYDSIIDIDFNAGKKLFNKFEIALEYKNASDFLQNAIFGAHDNNLKNIICAARENAIISRAYIDSEAFGSIIQLAMLFEEYANKKTAPDFVLIDEALSLISEIWGELTRKQERNAHNYFIKLGKSVENVDMHLRLGRDKAYALILLEEISNVVSALEPKSEIFIYNEKDTKPVLLESVNTIISKVIHY